MNQIVRAGRPIQDESESKDGFWMNGVTGRIASKRDWVTFPAGGWFAWNPSSVTQLGLDREIKLLAGLGGKCDSVKILIILCDLIGLSLVLTERRSRLSCLQQMWFAWYSSTVTHLRPSRLSCLQDSVANVIQWRYHRWPNQAQFDVIQWGYQDAKYNMEGNVVETSSVLTRY